MTGPQGMGPLVPGGGVPGYPGGADVDSAYDTYAKTLGTLWYSKLNRVVTDNSIVLAIPTGGTITTSGGRRYHKLLSDTDIFWTMKPAGLTVEIFLMGGGGSGGAASGGGPYSGGGGGGEPLVVSGVSITDGLYPLIGAGASGVSPTNQGNNGASTRVQFPLGTTLYTANGGSGGGNGVTASGAGRSGVGGGGGGGGSNSFSGAGGAGSGGAFAGGNGFGTTSFNSGGGGGGGAGGAGANGAVNAGGAGGAGFEYPTGSGTRYGGGGGGAAAVPASGGAGGSGGGGLGQGSTNGPGGGAANTGGGGGGARENNGSAGGGSGIAIVSYVYP